ncbi:MAG: hypothetical protein P4L22_07755 [Candidatus Babeliales bacterium]|nr:hypothetical protein [Candidatus Babeliales bacterium]
MKKIYFIIILFFSNSYSTVIYLINKTGARDAYLKIISPEGKWDLFDFKYGMDLPNDATCFEICVFEKNKIRAKSESIKIHANNIYTLKYEDNKFKIERSEQPAFFHSLLDIAPSSSDLIEE